MTTPQPGWRRPDARWLLLAPAGTVPVPVGDRWRTVQRLSGLPGGTPVALVGRRRVRGLRSIAWQAEVTPGQRYLVLPSADRPVAVTAPGPGLRWVARSVLTVPSGRYRGQLPATLAVRLARRAPWLLGAVGHRLLLGRRG